MMKKALSAAWAASYLGLLATNAMAQQPSPWLLRVRALHMETADKSEPVGGAGPPDRLTVSNKTIPELDISYFFSRNVAAELILGYSQKHAVMLDGANIGSFKHLSPTLLVQYHFTPESQWRPYLGAGINYTHIFSVHLLGGAATLERKSVGASLQAGLDYQIDQNWSINFDIKKVHIGSDVLASGTGQKISAVKVDPLLIGVGLGYRF